MLNMKDIVQLFLFPEGHFYDAFFLTTFQMKLYTLLTKYSDTSTFNFAHTINPMLSMMPY